MILASRTGVQAHVRVKNSQKKKAAGKGRPYVLLEIMGIRYLLTPAEAMNLADMLVDNAELAANSNQKEETHS